MTRKRIQFGEVPYVFVSNTTHQRKKIFQDRRLANLLIKVFRSYEAMGKYLVITFCVMPDHYHLVLKILKDYSLSQILHSINSFFVHEMFSDRKGKKEKIWARAWDVWIRSEDMYWQKIAYTLLNPWRAGLVKHPLDTYPYSNIDEWRRGYGDEFLLDLFGRYSQWGE